MTIARLSFARRTALEYMIVATKPPPHSVAVARSAPPAKVSERHASLAVAARATAPQHHTLLAAAATRRTLAAGDRLTPPRRPCTSSSSGELCAWTAPDRDGVCEVVGQEGPGAVVGSARLTGEIETAAYRAATAVDVCTWSHEELGRVLARTTASSAGSTCGCHCAPGRTSWSRSCGAPRCSRTSTCR